MLQRLNTNEGARELTVAGDGDSEAVTRREMRSQRERVLEPKDDLVLETGGEREGEGFILRFNQISRRRKRRAIIWFLTEIVCLRSIESTLRGCYMNFIKY